MTYLECILQRDLKIFSRQMSLMVNAGLYFICAILFDIPTAIYSIIYTACLTLAIDRNHTQNINVTCLIFSKKHNLCIQDEIMKSCIGE